jgi:hypothetical protein
MEKGKEKMKKKERIKTSTRSRNNKTTQQVWYFWVLDKILSSSDETDDPGCQQSHSVKDVEPSHCFL